MDRIKAIIVDDEEFARDVLCKLILYYCPEIEIVGQSNNVETSIELINKLTPELLFLDIHLGDQSSFEILKNVSTGNFDIIFTTADSQHGVNAFRVEATDYLLKPIDSDDLVKAIQKVQKKHQKNHASNIEKERFVVIPIHNRDVVVNINSNEIISLIAFNNYSKIVTVHGKNYISSKTLGDLEIVLKEDINFIRIHRSIIINTNFIENYSKTPPFNIKMKDGTLFEISRRRKTDVLKHLKK